MSVTVVYVPPPRHVCDLPDSRNFDLGTVIECDECHKQYAADMDRGSRSWLRRTVVVAPNPYRRPEERLGAELDARRARGERA